MARRAPPWRVPEGEDLRDDFDLSELLYRLMGQSAQGVLGSAEATATAIDPYIQALEEYVRRQSDPSAPLLGTGGAEAMGVIGEQILDHAGQVVGGFDEALGSPDYADLAQQGYEGAVHPHVRGAIGAVTDNPVAEKTWEWMTTPPVAEVGRGISAAAGSPLMPDVAKPAAEVAGWLGQNLTPLDALDALEPTGVPWAAGVGVGARVAKPFYSKALKAVADVKMPKHLPADQYRKMLAPQYRVMVKEGKKSKKVGQFLDLSEAETVAERVGGTINEIPGRVKGDELAWTGLDDWLKARGNQKTTKAEIQEYLEANQLDVQEVVKGAPLETESKYAIPEVRRIVGSDQGYADDAALLTLENDGDAYRALMRRFPELEGREDWAEVVLDDVTGTHGNVASATKFDNPSYQIPGGENYRELLLTMPERDAPGWSVVPRAEYAHKGPETPPFVVVDAQGVGHGGGGTPEDARRIVGGAMPGKFTGGHYDEPNVLAHVRFNDRTGPNGEKVLFLEEIQSDWAQKGRKEGYTRPEIKPGEIDVRFMESDVPEGHNPANYPGYWESFDTTTGDMISRHNGHLGEDRVRAEALNMGAIDRASGHPDMPWKKTWHEASFRRMVKWAADNGYDEVAWTTGAQQVERYKEALRKAVDKVEWKKTPDGVHITGFKDGKQVVSTVEKETAVSDAIGKSMGDTILQSPDQTGVFTGDEITIDSTGMAGFYDKMLPTYANKFGKKFGARAGTAELVVDRNPIVIKNKRTGDIVESFETVGEASRSLRGDYGMELYELVENPHKPPEVHTFPITDKMRTTAKGEGFPLFEIGAAALAGETLRSD